VGASVMGTILAEIRPRRSRVPFTSATEVGNERLTHWTRANQPRVIAFRNPSRSSQQVAPPFADQAHHSPIRKA